MKKFILPLILIIGVVIIIANYQDIYEKVVPPNPVIVSSHADGSSSKFLNYSMKIQGEIMNKGGAGTIVVEATVFQGSKKWTKRKTIFISSNNVGTVELIFDEVKLLAKSPTYSIDAFPLGSR